LFAEAPTAARTDRGERRPFELRHVAALDGLRGAAVAGVLLYHGDALTGGYLGVDLFFVLSGFLITALLLRDARRHGRIPLGPFWMRRARRLLPALGGFLVGIAVYALVWAPPGEGPSIRGDALATVAYVANWHALAGGSGYWEAFQAPSPLRHTWSLAIEEQFYLLWPLVVAAIVALAIRSRRSAAVPVAIVSVLGAAASYGWMAVSYRADTDPSRLYFGTDTRAGAILVGAALAAGWTARVWRGAGADADGRLRPGRVALEALALAAVALLAVTWVGLDGRAPLLYRGGFVATGLAVAAVIASVVHPVPGLVSRIFALAPLRALGLISYGLYLWHWPVYVVLQSERLRWNLDGPALLGVKIAVSLVLALVSYVVIERPIRRGGLAAWGRWGRAAMPIAAVASVLVVVVVTTVPGVMAPAPIVAAEQSLRPVDDMPVIEPGGGAPLRAVTPAGEGPVSGPLPRPAGRLPRVLVVGDSVGWDVGAALESDPSLGVVGLNRAIPACTLGRANSEWRHRGVAVEAEHERCREWERRWGDAVERFRPDAVVFVFAGPPSDELRIDGQWRPICGPDVTRYWRGEVDAALRVLGSGGATVYLTAPAPHRSPFFGADENEHLDCLRTVYEDAAADHRETTRWLRMDTWLCPSEGAGTGRPQDCVDTIDGVKLRHDGVHFIEEGRRAMARWVVSQLFEPADRPASPASS
jgi:peptidoglycan/LPS O-acetylase OafA/YrhL